MADENNNTKSGGSLFTGANCICRMTSGGQSNELADLKAREFIDQFNAAIAVLQEFEANLEKGLLKSLTIDANTEDIITTINNTVNNAKKLGSFILPTKPASTNESSLANGSIWIE